MVRLLTLLSALASVCTTLVLAQASNDDPRGKVLYVNYPSCDYYKCKVTWRPGQSVYVNWLNAPKGGLRIQLAPQDGTTGLSTYTITSNVGSIHGYNTGQCDRAGTNEKCGRFNWVVPANVKAGEYQVIVTSLAHPNKYVGYTDTVVIAKKGKRDGMMRMDDQKQQE
ncbi:hypothetical protein PSEUBRA_005573 [Kalmanozyma brasiliensis GHG001]|uniref:Uncharacterized protein n=1 Tax=Kalmanozyma brasiliensis (strain GHG001) TaxID=1365824 RepID=V5EQT4_KALBG|nr:uncharacterized protein PSEUBRA_005573 [Kalmanozyma brasiliensis GHG001]EST05303.1 hypothetical protein PSEUBRA_005573 [Kalmanozyma brasiliensis GHG001]